MAERDAPIQAAESALTPPGVPARTLGTPLASVIALVDVGDARAADCGPVLVGASAAAQRDTRGRPRDDVGRGTTAKAENGKSSPQEQKQQRKKFLGIFQLRA